MTIKSSHIKTILKITGIPIILLLLSLMFFNKINSSGKLLNAGNPYLETLPKKYHLKTIKSFQTGIVEKGAVRELFIIKENPSETEKTNDFIVEIYPAESKKPVIFKLTNDAVLYNKKNNIYGVFKFPLPFIDTDKIVVKSKNLKDTITNPFKNKIKIYKPVNDNKTTLKIKANPYLPLYYKVLKKFKIKHLPYSYKAEKKDLFQTSADVKEYALNNNLTLGIVDKQSFMDLISKNDSTTVSIDFTGKEKKTAQKLIQDFKQGKKDFDAVFNSQKIMNFKAINLLFGNNCNERLCFLYNSKSNLLEPFAVPVTCLGKKTSNLKKPVLNNNNFINDYTNALNNISKLDLTEEFLNKNTRLTKELSLINKNNPKNIFDYNILQLNQRMIQKGLNADKLLTTDLISFNNKQIKLLTKNYSIFPVKIKSLKYKKKRITSVDKIINSGETDTIVINLPKSFENLFVSKKSKKTGFNLHKHIYNLYLKYSLIGVEKNYKSPITPYVQELKLNKEDLLRKESTINQFKDISVDKSNKTITFNKKKVVITKPLIVPKGYKFVLNKGMEIDIQQGGKIISYAPLFFKGTEKEPVKIFSSDKNGQGLIVFSDGKKSELEHVIFDDLTNLQHGYWSVSGTVMFYESPVDLNYVTISNNSSEDALNIVRTTFKINNSKILNTQSDAFDGDFVTGIVQNTEFINAGNDAIDVSGSDIIIKNVKITNAGDKGLSAGENSKMQVENIVIDKSEIAVAGKDLSKITGNNFTINNTKLAFTAFQKKPEFGPSNIIVKKVTFNNVNTKYLIENTSELIVDGKQIKTKNNNVKSRMYGVEFGVSTKSTKYKKKK